MEDANIPITSKKVSIGIPLRTWMFLNRFSVTTGACGGAACCADTRVDVAASRPAIAVAMAQTIGRLRPHLILCLPTLYSPWQLLRSNLLPCGASGLPCG